VRDGLADHSLRDHGENLRVQCWEHSKR
jgi:hypothetical protein